jgi:hypothetical protein
MAKMIWSFFSDFQFNLECIFTHRRCQKIRSYFRVLWKYNFACNCELQLQSRSMILKENLRTDKPNENDQNENDQNENDQNENDQNENDQNEIKCFKC